MNVREKVAAALFLAGAASMRIAQQLVRKKAR